MNKMKKETSLIEATAEMMDKRREQVAEEQDSRWKKLLMNVCGAGLLIASITVLALSGNMSHPGIAAFSSGLLTMYSLYVLIKEKDPVSDMLEEDECDV